MKDSKLIPDTTIVLGKQINILWDTDRIKERGLYGSINISTGELHLASEVHGHPVSKNEKEVTYLHEMFHYILHKNGYESKLEKANIDLEELVEDLAEGIHQALTNKQ